MPGFRKLIFTVAALALAMFALAACGGDDDDSSDGGTPAAEQTSETTTSEDEPGGSGGGSEPSGGAGGTVEIEADPGALAYTTGDVTTKAGEVTIAFDNPADIGHDVRIEDSSGNDVGGTDVITNDSTTATVELEPGEYTYYCSVPGHRPAGMEGKLTAE